MSNGQTGPGRRVGWRKDKDAVATRHSPREASHKPAVHEPPANSSRKNQQNRAAYKRKTHPEASVSDLHPRPHKRKYKRSGSVGLSLGKKTSKQPHQQRQRDAKERQRQRQAFVQRLHSVFADLVKERLSSDQLTEVVLSAFYAAVGEFGYGRVNAADCVANFFGVHQRTVLHWAALLEVDIFDDAEGEELESATDERLRQLVLGSGALAESLRARHVSSRWLLSDPEKQQRARDWALTHARPKGKPRMKARDFAKFVSEELLSDELRALGKEKISDSTAVAWLHKLGLDVGPVGKGIDLNVHERADVIEQRDVYVAEAIEDKKRNVGRYWQDETISNSAEGELRGWKLVGQQLLQKKLKGGQSIMTSQFLSWLGLLKGAGLNLEIARDGTFDNAKFLAQVASCALRC
jgi:hypothetical protein